MPFQTSHFIKCKEDRLSVSVWHKFGSEPDELEKSVTSLPTKQRGNSHKLQDNKVGYANYGIIPPVPYQKNRYELFHD